MKKISDIRIIKAQGTLSSNYIRRMVEIMIHYFQDPDLMEKVLYSHIEHADTVRLAWNENQIVGFSIASKLKQNTPFYPAPVNILFQRMLYLDPEVFYHGLGLRLAAATMRDLFGLFWPFKRFVTICRTQNPRVVKLMNMYNVTYPQYNQALPAAIRKYGESLLPLLGASELDPKCRLIGTLDAFKDKDYTEIFNRFLRYNHNLYENMILESAFRVEDGRIFNSGAFILLIGYARPLHFIRYLLHK